MLFDDWVIEVLDDERGAMRQLAPMVKMSATSPAVGIAPRRNAHARELRDAPARSVGPAPGGADPHGPPLEGVTIVELSSYYAAPFGATLFTDLGARVIKLEPVTGDPHRYMLPELPEAAAIKALQGKQSVAVNMGTPEGLQIAYDVVRHADVVLQSFRAGAARRLLLDHETLLAINPNLIYLTAPGYGPGGPCGHRPAYAPTIAAGAGVGRRNTGGSILERADMTFGPGEVQHAATLGLVVRVGAS